MPAYTIRSPGAFGLGELKRVMEFRSYGQAKSSIAPLFQSGAINNAFKLVGIKA